MTSCWGSSCCHRLVDLLYWLEPMVLFGTLSIRSHYCVSLNSRSCTQRMFFLRQSWITLLHSGSHWGERGIGGLQDRSPVLRSCRVRVSRILLLRLCRSCCHLTPVSLWNDSNLALRHSIRDPSPRNCGSCSEAAWHPQCLQTVYKLSY